jgi:protein-L-isoaspartate(D-aspartate) O-methyltransferase
MDYAELRELMVSRQLMARGIKDVRVLGAMRKVPRHLFVSPDLRQMAYDDMALQIGEGQTISQPYMVAIMTELLELQGDERVLEVGTGSGYQTAILAELSRDVYTVERLEDLTFAAKERLASLGYGNVYFMVGDGSAGLPDEAPFDRVLVTASAPEIPGPLKEQLGEGGIIITPVGSLSTQELVKAVRRKDRFQESRHTPCVFVPLLGKFGWEK